MLPGSSTSKIAYRRSGLRGVRQRGTSLRARNVQTRADVRMGRVSAYRRSGARGWNCTLGPLVAVGSGGSLSTAHFLAQTHQSIAGQLARISTPAELINEPAPHAASVWLLSAGGGNVDINAAFEDAVVREPRQLAVLCGRARSPLSRAAQCHAYSDLLMFEPPAGKDGFLATNSLFGFAVLLARSYLRATESSVGWDAVQHQVERLLSDEGIARWRDAVAPIWNAQRRSCCMVECTRGGARS